MGLCCPHIFATCHLWKYRHRVYWILWYSLIILKVTFLKSNPFRFKETNFVQYQIKITPRERGCNQTLLREMLIEATFNQTNFWLFFSQSCNITSEFSYIICSYLRRFVVQNSLKCTETLQIFFDPLPNPIGIFD